jgi:hypothetical protein
MNNTIPGLPDQRKHWSEETDWQRLSDIVARLKGAVDAGIFDGDEFAAEVAHDDLISAEHRLRMAERRRDRG